MRVSEFGWTGTPLRRQLVELILRGEKTATAGLVLDYEAEGEELPMVGELFVVLDFDDEPVAVIETTEVRVVRAADVDEQFARDEGEGFESVADWREAHERFFEAYSFDDDTPIVCERFKLVRTL
ncbi:MAG: ASCH domain-containing protein [Thermoleophilia bacterium]